MPVLESLDDCLKRNLTPSVQLLQELVRLGGTRGAEGPVLERVQQEFAQLGVAMTRVPIDPEKLAAVPGYSPASIDYSRTYNLSGRVPGRGGGRSMVVNFHLDIAAPGPAELWQRSPFSGDIVDGKLYGRGAWDDKAGAALAVLVLRALREAGIQLKGDVLFQAVVEDECTGNGSLALVEAGHEADAAIILDGAYGPFAIVGHPGHTAFRLTVYGKPAPSCRADLGVSALEKLFPLLQRLRQLEGECNARLPEDWKDVASPVSFNIGPVQGGSWTGAVMEKCQVDCVMAFLPPFTLASFRDYLRQQLAEVAESDAWLRDHPPQIHFHDLATEPVKLEADNPFMQSLSRACQEVFGAALTPRLVTGWCDIRHFQRRKPTPCCLFGPGRGSNAHRPDEYFELDQLEPHARVLLRHLIEWCGLAD